MCCSATFSIIVEEFCGFRVQPVTFFPPFALSLRCHTHTRTHTQTFCPLSAFIVLLVRSHYWPLCRPLQPKKLNQTPPLNNPSPPSLLLLLCSFSPPLLFFLICTQLDNSSCAHRQCTAVTPPHAPHLQSSLDSASSNICRIHSRLLQRGIKVKRVKLNLMADFF